MSDLTAVSLFAGIGGIDEALRRAGVNVVASAEIDPACRGVLRRHFPETAVFNDVTKVKGDELRAAGFVPGHGILAAGWPCQGNSIAGRRSGMADPRSGLWVHVARLLAEVRPSWFIGENVPGLLSVNGGRDIALVRRNLAQLGYWWAERILDAQFFGVPQRRRRVFLVAGLGDPCGPVEVLLEPDSSPGHPAAGRTAGQDAPGTLGSRAGGSRTTDLDGHGACVVSTLQGGGRRGHRIDAESAAGGHLIALPLALRGREGGSSAEAGEDGDPAFTLRACQGGSSMPMVATVGGQGVDHALTASDASEDGTGRGTPIVAYTLTAHHNRDSGRTYITAPTAFNPQTGGSKGRLGWGEKPTALQANQVTAVAVGVSENQRGEVLETAYSHQLTTGGGKPGQGYGAVRTGTAVRRLTPTECERLQGFEDGWTLLDADGSQQSDSARYRQLGNAVAVPVAGWIARRLVAVDARLRGERAS